MPDFENDSEFLISLPPPSQDSDNDQTRYSQTHNGFGPSSGQTYSSVVDNISAVKNQAKTREVTLIVDETPAGFAQLFKYSKALGLDMSDAADRLATLPSPLSESGYFDDPANVNEEEYNSLIADLEVDLLVAAKQLRPQDFLDKIYYKYVGDSETREAARSDLDAALSDILAGETIPGEVATYEVIKEKFIEQMQVGNRFWVHRDKGIIRPEGFMLFGASKELLMDDRVRAHSFHNKDAPRYTVHGTIDAAIDVKPNIYGSGGHGEGGQIGNTVVASPMAELVDKNKMPQNFESADTFFKITDEGLKLPAGTIYVTISAMDAPADIQANEIWLPSEIPIGDDLALAAISNQLLVQAEKCPSLKQFIEHVKPAFWNREHVYDEAQDKMVENESGELTRYLKTIGLYTRYGHKDKEGQDLLSAGDIAYELQTEIINTIISIRRGSEDEPAEIPVFESFGRGLDWDIKGQREQINTEYTLAESLGISGSRHPDSDEGGSEHQLMAGLRFEAEADAILDPRDRDYSNQHNIIKGLRFADAIGWLRKGFSFDQLHKPREGGYNQYGVFQLRQTRG